MIKTAKAVLRHTPIWPLAQRWHKSGLYVDLWSQGHLTPPPYEVKRLTIRLYAELYGVRTFVETGTYQGDTVEAVRGLFDAIYSIELQPSLAAAARERFAGVPDVHILEGDSGDLLGDVLRETLGSCLLWLDGHYSTGQTARGASDTPIVAELAHIFADPSRHHVVLIDDARLFMGKGDYPKISELRRLVHRYRPDYVFDVSHDIIRAAPRQADA